ncbi:hypothetical protein [Bacillus sp. PK3_68]|uniref:hypothetical protein n=1 Tax=Bacillus sp. PK3_68 TaxID=2027408 RepID=UPI000E70EC40|nr:hypothetical protein [Bacillus sp. PK3_68]RJS59134.1 hypothetical protein CJ483_02860 [Bacillus sp. PK3_68]
MYEYNFHLGYQKKTGEFPRLGKIKYPYPLQKGDVIIVSNQIFKEIGKAAKEVSKSTLEHNQQYRIGSIHHTIDSHVNLIPEIYLVTEADYLAKHKD